MAVRKAKRFTYVFRDTLASRSPLEASPLARDALERLERFFVKIAVGELGTAVGEEVVGEQVRGRVERKVREWASKIATICRD